MRESVTYQAILEEGEQTGRIKELHRMILQLGRVRFGEADEAVQYGMSSASEVVFVGVHDSSCRRSSSRAPAR